MKNPFKKSTSPKGPSWGDERSKRLSFFEAMKEVLNGKHIYKEEWGDKAYYGFLNDTILSLHKPDGINYQWVISLGDMEGEDYIVL